MSDNKRSDGGFGTKGYYIALILCAAAIGITSYVYHRSAEQLREVEPEQTQQVQAGTMATEDVPVLATQPQPTGPSATAPTQTTAPAPTRKEPMKTVSPVSGKTIHGYSMEALSYNQTTRDWRVHNGVDIAAETGTQVLAAAAGEVAAVYNDDALGCTVVIRHDGGYTTCYASLTEDAAVRAGDTVQAGQVIGYAGDTAIVETGLGSHVHFSVTHNDEPMDPEAFLSLGQ